MKKVITYALIMWVLSVLLGSLLGGLVVAIWEAKLEALMMAPLLIVYSGIASSPVILAMVVMAQFSKSQTTGEVDDLRFLKLTPIPTVIAALIGLIIVGASFSELLVLAPYQLATWLVLLYRLINKRDA